MSQIAPASAAQRQGIAAEAAACDFVDSYVVSLEVAAADAGGGLHLVAAVSDFALMGERVSRGCDSIAGKISADGNDLSFICGGTQVTVTNLSVADFENEQGGSSLAEPISYAQWAADFPTFDLGASEGDADGDGNANLLEYALGLNPTVPDGRGVGRVQQETVGGERFLTLRYDRDLSKTGVVVEVQTSADLSGAGWASVGVEDVLVSTNGQIESRIAMVRASGGGRQFMRLVVRRP